MIKLTMIDKNNTIYKTIFSSPLGDLYALSFENHLIMLSFNQDDLVEKRVKQLRKYLKANIIKNDELELFKDLKKQVEEYFSKKREKFEIPIKLYGTPFQIEVWKALQKIPYGETISYKKEAQMIGNTKAFRAVANANGKNDLSIIIPCHRVIASDGKIGGYTGGVWIKEFLLKLEGVIK